MNALIQAALAHSRTVTVAVLTVIIVGALAATLVPVDILPVFKSPAVQVLTFYGGMPASSVEKDITNRMERWTGQAAGTVRQESRSIVGASIIRNYFFADIDPNGALTQVNSLASAAIPNLPPGTLPPVILPFDPTGTVPTCLVALDSKSETEAILYDVGRYEVRNMVMGVQGAAAPVVYGGRIRAVLAYLDRISLEARNLSPLDVMQALDAYNAFLPTGSVKLGDKDYAIDSNSMFQEVEQMGEIPLRTEPGNSAFLRDVATPRDASFIQTNVVRVNGRRQVYIPVYRQLGASTLDVVDTLSMRLPDIQARLTRPDVDLHLVMDQSIYVRHSIRSLIQEGVLGAVLCSLVILLFLGEWRMTAIAVMTIPISVLAAIACLYYSSNTINVMTLAGLSLAIGPMVDSAIICLENTHRHLSQGVERTEAAFLGASEVAMPELAASLSTLLVLAPLALAPGSGQFLFKPMALAVAFAMISAYLLSRSFVPARCATWLKSPAPVGEENGQEERRGLFGRGFARWEAIVESATAWYVRMLERLLRRRLLVVFVAAAAFIGVVVGVGSQLRREFFPEVDAGAFEITARGASGTRIEVTEATIGEVEQFIRVNLGDDLQMIISELGVTPDWSAAYTSNSGPMDAVIKVQLQAERSRSAQQCVRLLREGLAKDSRFNEMEFAFDAGGMIRGALNEGRSTPLNIRFTAHDIEDADRLAKAVQAEVSHVPGVVDCRIVQRLDYPQFLINVDRAKAAELGLTQLNVIQNVIAALNSSIQFNKRNFWIDPISHNQYYVGVQYPEEDIVSIDTLFDIPITSPLQKIAIPLSNVVSIEQTYVPAEATHSNLQPTIDLAMGVDGRDLGHVADDVRKIVDRFGQEQTRGEWVPYVPGSKQLVQGGQMTLSGEYSRMQDAFRKSGFGMILATLLIYFLLVALLDSYVAPLVVLSAVPLGVVGVVLMLYATGTAINVQSLLGIIFMVGIVVSNTVLLIDFAQKMRKEEGLGATEAVCRAAAIRARPVVMTALAAFFALLPMAMAVERGSEANAPLGRAVIGGLLAGLVTTLGMVPVIYSLAMGERGEVRGENPFEQLGEGEQLA